MLSVSSLFPLNPKRISFPRPAMRSCIAVLARFALVTAFSAIAASILHAQSAAPQFVYSASGHTIFAYQLNTSTGVLTPVPGSPFNDRLNALILAVNPAGTFLFAANDANNVSVFAINTSTGAITEVPNSPFATGLGMNPTVIATDLSGKYLYVGNQTGTQFSSQGQIDAYAIDPSTGQLTPTPNSTPPNIGAIGVPFNPSGIYVHPNGRWIYFQGGNGGPGGVFADIVQGYAIDPATGDLINSIPAEIGSGFARALAGDPAGTFLIDEFGESCISMEMLSISAVDGSLRQVFDWNSVASGLDVCLGGNSVVVDSSGAFLYTALGSFFVKGGQIVPNQVNPATPLPVGPWAADQLGPFVFALGNGLNSYAVDPATGNLASAPGSPYIGGTALVITGFPVQTPAPGAQFSPAGLTFSNSTVGAMSAPQTIELVNTGTATLNIAGISITGANSADFMQTNTCAATLAPGANCQFTITFTPSTTAAESALLAVTDNAAGSPHSAYLISTGVILTPPSPSLSPTSLTFSSTSVGSTALMSFSIMNSGDQTLAVSSVAIGGSNPGDFSQTNSCASVAGDSSCSVTVVFQPKAAGQRTATVNVSYGGNLGSGSVALTGQGAAFTVAPSGPTSSTVAPGQPANYTANFAPAPGFSGTATFTCTVVPAGPACSVMPSMLQIVASNNPAVMPIAVTATSSAANNRRRSSLLGASHWTDVFTFERASVSWFAALVLLAFFMPVTVAGISGARQIPRRRITWTGAATLVAIAALGAIASCGGGSGTTPPPQPQNFTVTLTSVAGTTTQSINFSLTVQ